VRTAYEAMAAALGGTQSLHTNSFDEAIALPTEFSARIARNTQLILQHETGICDVADPLAGSYYVEALTAALAGEAWKLMEEVETHGGMTRAVMEGLPKVRIEEAAARRQARIDRGEDVIVGVNRFPPPPGDPVDYREIDNAAVRLRQIARLEATRKRRDAAACAAALAALEKVARGGEGNILAVAIDAARARATVGEMSMALEKAWGRYRPVTRLVAGVYGGEWGDDPAFARVKGEVAAIAARLGRSPKLLVVKMGQDGHDRGAKVIATAFADLGFSVAIGPLFSTPQEAAELAVAENADVIGVSSHAAGHLTLAPMLLAELARRGAADRVVVAGGVIPVRDHAPLKEAGVAAIYGPGANILESASGLLALLSERLRGRNR
jgi:methylmalonyl-CoA mutase